MLVGIAAGLVAVSVVVVRGGAPMVVRLEEIPGGVLARRVVVFAVADGAFGMLLDAEVEFGEAAGALGTTEGEAGAGELVRVAVAEVFGAAGVVVALGVEPVDVAFAAVAGAAPIPPPLAANVSCGMAVSAMLDRCRSEAVSCTLLTPASPISTVWPAVTSNGVAIGSRSAFTAVTPEYTITVVRPGLSST